MAKRKFSKRAFKKWLDTLTKVCVKTRDDFTCQIKRPKDDTGECSGRMQPLDNNCQWCHIKSRNSNNLRFDLLNALCGCGHCHHWAHDNPVLFGVWFAENYKVRYDYIGLPRKNFTWREDDFRKAERYLLLKAIDLEVDVLNIPDRGARQYRKRFKKRIEELKDGL